MIPITECASSWEKMFRSAGSSGSRGRQSFMTGRRDGGATSARKVTTRAGKQIRSAVEHRGEIEKTFLEQEAEKLMVPIKFKDAKRIYGNRPEGSSTGGIGAGPRRVSCDP